ncbi:hypothetical protein GCM10023186_28850 [Hymenobacter koreensis]|uniref:OmpA-like domain-containing protein n=1 Tax=Hymenobacter koreensis TaxID=1084523 RepID=A0ABP8J5J9_9BACT
MLTLVLAVSWLQLRAQSGLSTYADAKTGYRLSYPLSWQVYQADGQTGTTVFYVGDDWRQAPAAVTLTIRSLSANRQGLNLLTAGEPDSIRQRILRLPEGQVLRLQPNDGGYFQEVRYDYTFTPPAAGRTFVLGRRLWRDGYEFELEYRASAEQTPRYRTVGRQLLESFVLIEQPRAKRSALPRNQSVAVVNPNQPCDDKMYGIAALRAHDGLWEDDCRTIHEFSSRDLSAPPKIHRRVLPFQSYALAKGFDNCLYSVTKAPSDQPELVYRYDPATRKGGYTTWRLPAQGPENVWISAATDERGDLYFMTSDGNLLVKVSPVTDAVQTIWTTDPVQRAPYYKAIGFAGAGTHANFCLDDGGTIYRVYSTDGALLQVNLATRRAAPDLIPLDGLPERGGYSDLLLQTDAEGQRRMYLAGPKALYEVDLARRQATRVRRGTYTDLAGCNVFKAPVAPISPAATPPAAATWRGRVLDAVTRQPLPQARLQFRTNGTDTAVPLSAEGSFSANVAPGAAYGVRAQLSGYLSTDSLLTMPGGAYERDILLRPLAVGMTLPLKNVQFLQGQAVLLESSFPALDQLVSLLTTNPGMTIELRGHTDNVGDVQKNKVLSEERTAAVKTYLVNHGIAAARISGIGLGGTEPRASNAKEATRQLNRRVEFRVTGVN